MGLARSFSIRAVAVTLGTVVAGFVRGFAVPGVEIQYYGCEKFDECLAEPVPESKFKPHNPRHCAHGPMTVPLVKANGR